MLGSPEPGSEPQSSSRPSTTKIKRRPAFIARAETVFHSWRRNPSRATADVNGGTSSQVTAASWSSSASVNAALSAWAASRAVTKNDTTHGPACHDAYASPCPCTRPPAHPARPPGPASAAGRCRQPAGCTPDRSHQVGGPASTAARSRSAQAARYRRTPFLTSESSAPSACSSALACCSLTFSQRLSRDHFVLE